MQRFQSVALVQGDSTVAPLADVDVFLTGTTTRVDLFEDADGLTPLGNPCQADVDGYYFFYTADARLDVQISGGGIVAPYVQWGDVWVGEANGVPACTFAQLPTPRKAGSLRYVTDNTRDLWHDTGTQWVREGLYLNVRDWGAVGDNITNDTAAIQACLDASYAYRVPAFFPSGYTFVVTDSLTSTSHSGVSIYGGGYGARIMNRASAGKPTFAFSHTQYLRLRDVSILGDELYPNEAIYLTNNTAYFSIERVFMCPNGNGIHAAAAAMSGVSTGLVTDCAWWPSGFADGEVGVVGTHNLHAWTADGAGSVNGITITALNAVGTRPIAEGGSTIKWNTGTVSGGIIIASCELELGDRTLFRSIHLTNVFSVNMTGNFCENSEVLIENSRFVSIENSDEGSAVTYSIGNGCVDVILNNSYAAYFNADNTCERCGASHSTFSGGSAPSGYENNSTQPFTLDVAGDGSVRVADSIGTVGVKTYGRTVPSGEWVIPTYDAAAFTATVGTWTVPNANPGRVTYSLMLQGKTGTLSVVLTGTSVSNVTNSVFITLPNGLLAAQDGQYSCLQVVNNGGANETGFATTTAGSGLIRLRRQTGDWAISVAGTVIFGQIVFEFQ